MARSILCRPGVCGGEPHIEGTPHSCGSVVRDLQGLALVEAMVAERDLACADLLACAEYCASRQCLTDEPEHYCEGCTLDMRGGEDAARGDLWVQARMLASQIREFIQLSGG